MPHDREDEVVMPGPAWLGEEIQADGGIEPDVETIIREYLEG